MKDGGVVIKRPRTCVEGPKRERQGNGRAGGHLRTRRKMWGKEVERRTVLISEGRDMCGEYIV